MIEGKRGLQVRAVGHDGVQSHNSGWRGRGQGISSVEITTAAATTTRNQLAHGQNIADRHPFAFMPAGMNHLVVLRVHTEISLGVNRNMLQPLMVVKYNRIVILAGRSGYAE